MKIAATGVAIPSLRVTNQDLLDLMRGPDATRQAADRALIERAMKRCGSETRFFRDRAAGETALDLIVSASSEALRSSGVKPSRIQLLIYCGVGRGFLEPATAYLICRALGVSCECFDVLDACMGWTRALHIAHAFLQAGTYSGILLVAGEFNMYEHGYPELTQAVDPAMLRYTFPAFTIGEAAVATVLVASDRQWTFRFRSDPSKAGLCTLPIEGHAEYSGGEDLAPNGAGRFMSRGEELSAAALRQGVRFIEECCHQPEAVDIWFPHTANIALCRAAARRAKLPGKVYTDGFRRYGNVVSASIPLAMSLAAQDGELQNGDRFMLAPVSAGMSLALVESVY